MDQGGLQSSSPFARPPSWHTGPVSGMLGIVDIRFLQNERPPDARGANGGFHEYYERPSTSGQVSRY